MAANAINEEEAVVVNEYTHGSMRTLSQLVDSHSGRRFVDLSEDEKTDVLFNTSEAVVLFFGEWLVQQSNTAITTGYIAVLARCLSRLKMSLDMAGAPANVLANFVACRKVAKKLLNISLASSASLGEDNVFLRLEKEGGGNSIIEALREIEDWDNEDGNLDDVPPAADVEQAPATKRKRKLSNAKQLSPDPESAADNSGGDVATNSGTSTQAKVRKASRSKKVAEAGNMNDTMEYISGDVTPDMYTYEQYRSKEGSRRVTKFGLTATAVFGCRSTMYRLDDFKALDMEPCLKGCVSAATLALSKNKGTYSKQVFGKAIAAYVTTFLKKVWAGDSFGAIFAGPLLVDQAEGDTPATYRSRQAALWAKLLFDVTKVIFKGKSQTPATIVSSYEEGMKAVKISIDHHIRSAAAKGRTSKKKNAKGGDDGDKSNEMTDDDLMDN